MSLARLVVATTNQNKAREIRSLLAGVPLEIVTLARWPDASIPDESGATFEENARAKVRHYAAITGEVTVAEDSGLEIDALGGRPGVESARFGGANATYPEKFAKIYDELAATRSQEWTARFVCALALARGEKILFEARGTIEGTIAPAPRGSGGFGYDPIFFYPPFGMTLAEAGGRKSEVSHRAHAFRALRAFLARTTALCLVSLALGARASAQSVPLVGPARDAAREEFVDRAVFDPLLLAPLTAEPQAVVDVHGSDVNVAAHAAVRNGDDSYGVTVSAPLSRADALAAPIDPRGLRRYPTLGVELTNVIWRPKATPSERVPDIPWVGFFHASYEFARTEYTFAEPSAFQRRAETHLNDSASLMLGLQTRMTAADPGYFFGASFVYSAVFRDAADVNGNPEAPPHKVRANTVRLEMRRLIADARAGVNPSYSYDTSSRTATVDAAAYVRGRGAAGKAGARFYGGVRAGYRTGTAGAFVTVFGGALFKTAGRSASASRD
jgi:XTP/dITP diphosphohydrolase